MTLLIPLGLLGLLGVVALIIIYLIKPNYQQRFISSTYIWKLSLKYKKKRIPISKFRNLLLILCQILILTSLALILAKPAIVLRERSGANEVIAIIDSSASMRAENDAGVKRFERAVEKVKTLAAETVANKGIVSVLMTPSQKVATEEQSLLTNSVPSYDFVLLQEGNLDNINDKMDEVVDGNTECSYGNASIDDAINKCDDIIKDNPNVKIYLYTDKDYDYPPSTVTVVNVADTEEWNAAILDATAETEDNTYVFTVDLAVYGNRDENVDLKIEIYGANKTSSDPDGVDKEYNVSVECFAGIPVTVVFRYEDSEYFNDKETENIKIVPLGDHERVFSFESAEISIDVEDSFRTDDYFSIYGEEKDKIKVLYASPMRNSFVSSIMDLMKYRNTDNWDVQYDAPSLSADDDNKYQESINEYITADIYDLYIFEHIMPKTMPKNGVVFLINPDRAPQGAEFMVNGDFTVPGKQSLPLASETENHPLMKNVNPESITVSKYMRITNLGGGYDVLASCDGNPVLFARNEGELQTVVMGFSEHYSNISITLNFPMLFLNLFNYYFPDAVNLDSVEVYQSIVLNSRSQSVNVNGIDTDEIIDEFPANIHFNTPGSYTISQTTYFDKYLSRKVFVKIPAGESNISERGDTFEAPLFIVDESEYFRDLLLYLEIALVALLFAEWILHLREGA